MNSFGGALLLITATPQLERQPFIPGTEVPGAPKGRGIQNSSVVPHCPQMLQQALSGHGFKCTQSLLLSPEGFTVPLFRGPQTALDSGSGNGDSPSEIHILSSGWIPSHPDQPYVFLFSRSISLTVRSFIPPILLHVSPFTVLWTAHVPSLFLFFLKSG